MSIMREDFRKMIARHDGVFTFQAEWLNMLRGKDDNYIDWFLDVVMAYVIFGYILSDMPNSMKVDMKPVIDAIFEDIVDGNNPFASKLMMFEMEEFISDYRCYCDEVEELKEKEAKEV